MRFGLLLSLGEQNISGVFHNKLFLHDNPNIVSYVNH
ncbi:hypothetical protein BA1DRAFT_00397 [Photorhabdus aegyptia]|uniref:Uncharacterized protein n=1 Tax=Photorhabdus aegyptia TaxID=2805098 RepID=A0A022PQI5_9GAMM|nr:hypothetical protein BA1DRAFT_00397 [Photorhabdus aegyptia]